MHFADEYDDYSHSMVDKREVQKNSFGSTGLDGAILQFLIEWPLTLKNLMETRLASDEKTYLFSKKGSEWFARTFKEFSPSDRV